MGIDNKKLFGEFVRQFKRPPLQLTKDLDGNCIYVDLLEPLRFGKWWCLHFDSELVMDDSQVNPDSWE